MDKITEARQVGEGPAAAQENTYIPLLEELPSTNIFARQSHVNSTNITMYSSTHMPIYYLPISEYRLTCHELIIVF